MDAPTPGCGRTQIFGWADDDGRPIARLKQLKNEGYSAGKIASLMTEEFRHRLTRNAIIGKLCRLGLRTQMSPERRAKIARNQAATKRVPGRPEGKPPGAWTIQQPLTRAEGIRFGRKSAVEQYPVIVDADIPPAQRKSLPDLTESTCRWPVGDPHDADFFFCGAEIKSGRCYCDGHRARGYCGIQRSLRIQAIGGAA